MAIEMSSVDLSDEARIAAIESLELSDVTSSSQWRIQSLRSTVDTPQSGSSESALVTGNNVVSFVGGLTPQQKQDVQDCVLFAQMATDKAFPDKKRYRQERFDFYTDVLTLCGWVATNNSFKEVAGLKQKFTMDQVALDIIASVVGVNKALLDIVAVVFKALQKNPKALALFENEASGNESADFQILPCIGTVDGEVIMIKSAFHLTSPKRITKVLFWEWSSNSVHLYAGANNTTLNQKVYAGVRQSISDKLAFTTKKRIEKIEI